MDSALSDVAAALEKKHGKSKVPPMKRPASAITKSKVGAVGGVPAGPKPSLTNVKSRNNVVARTGIAGKGQTKTFSYGSGPFEHAMEQGAERLKAKCDEMGIAWDE